MKTSKKFFFIRNQNNKELEDTGEIGQIKVDIRKQTVK